MKKYRNASDLCELTMSHPKGETMTKPDQAMSVREILHRYTNGLPMNVNGNTPTYLENVPLYDVSRKHNIDLAEDRYKNERNIEKLEKDVKGNIRLQSLERKKAADEKSRLFMGQQNKKLDSSNPNGDNVS